MMLLASLTRYVARIITPIGVLSSLLDSSSTARSTTALSSSLHGLLPLRFRLVSPSSTAFRWMAAGDLPGSLFAQPPHDAERWLRYHFRSVSTSSSVHLGFTTATTQSGGQPPELRA